MERKDKILLAAQELFFKYGIHSVSMDDIAKHLSISKKTIYQIYKDKNELVHELFTGTFKKNRIDFKALEKKSANVIEEVFQIMRRVRKATTEINPSVFYDLQKYHPDSWKLFKEFKENCILKMVEETLTRGIKQGLVRPDINAKILSRMRMEQITMSMNPEVFPPAQFKFSDVQFSLIEHFLYGIGTVKAHKLIHKYKQIIDEE